MDLIKKVISVFIGSDKVPTDDTSDRGKLDKMDIAKTIRNLILGILAAGLTHYIEDPETLAKYGAISVVGLKFVFDIVQKFIKKNPVEVEA